MATKEEKNKFSSMILEKAKKCDSETPHIECIVEYCVENMLEEQLAKQLVNDVLYQKIEEEAQRVRYIKRSSKLPL